MGGLKAKTWFCPKILEITSDVGMTVKECFDQTESCNISAPWCGRSIIDLRMKLTYGPAGHRNFRQSGLCLCSLVVRCYLLDASPHVDSCGDLWYVHPVFGETDTIIRWRLRFRAGSDGEFIRRSMIECPHFGDEVCADGREVESGRLHSNQCRKQISVLFRLSLFVLGF